jgi:hypothetical protein
VAIGSRLSRLRRLPWRRRAQRGDDPHRHGPGESHRGPTAKVFAIVYSLFSGVFFLTMVAVLLAPALHHFLHRFHIEFDERSRGRKTD